MRRADIAETSVYLQNRNLSLQLFAIIINYKLQIMQQNLYSASYKTGRQRLTAKTRPL